MSLRDKHCTAPTMETMCQNTSSAEAMKFANPGPGTGGSRAQVLEMHGDALILVHCVGPGAGGAWECTGPDAGGAWAVVQEVHRSWWEVCSMSCIRAAQSKKEAQFRRWCSKSPHHRITRFRNFSSLVHGHISELIIA